MDFLMMMTSLDRQGDIVKMEQCLGLLFEEGKHYTTNNRDGDDDDDDDEKNDCSSNTNRNTNDNSSDSNRNFSGDSKNNNDDDKKYSFDSMTDEYNRVLSLALEQIMGAYTQALPAHDGNPLVQASAECIPIQPPSYAVPYPYSYMSPILPSWAKKELTRSRTYKERQFEFTRPPVEVPPSTKKNAKNKSLAAHIGGTRKRMRADLHDRIHCRWNRLIEHHASLAPTTSPLSYPSVHACNTLLYYYARRGHIYPLRDLFDEMMMAVSKHTSRHAHSFPNTTSLNLLFHAVKGRASIGVVKKYMALMIPPGVSELAVHSLAQREEDFAAAGGRERNQSLIKSSKERIRYQMQKSRLFGHSLAANRVKDKEWARLVRKIEMNFDTYLVLFDILSREMDSGYNADVDILLMCIEKAQGEAPKAVNTGYMRTVSTGSAKERGQGKQNQKPSKGKGRGKEKGQGTGEEAEKAGPSSSQTLTAGNGEANRVTGIERPLDKQPPFSFAVDYFSSTRKFSSPTITCMLQASFPHQAYYESEFLYHDKRYEPFQLYRPHWDQIDTDRKMPAKTKFVRRNFFTDLDDKELPDNDVFNIFSQKDPLPPHHIIPAPPPLPPTPDEDGITQKTQFNRCIARILYHGSTGDIDSAREMFVKMRTQYGFAGTKTLYSALLSAYVVSGHVLPEGLELLQAMHADDVPPSLYIRNLFLEALLRSRRLPMFHEQAASQTYTDKISSLAFEGLYKKGNADRNCIDEDGDDASVSDAKQSKRFGLRAPRVQKLLSDLPEYHHHNYTVEGVQHDRPLTRREREKFWALLQAIQKELEVREWENHENQDLTKGRRKKRTFDAWLPLWKEHTVVDGGFRIRRFPTPVLESEREKE